VTTTLSWAEANRCHLMAEIGVLRERLKAYGLADAAGDAAGEEKALEALAQAARAMPAPPALDRLAEAFGLSTFERWILVLAASVELDSSMAALCIALQGDARRMAPTFSLALAALPEPHWSALSPGSPLRKWSLVEPGPGDSLTLRPLRIDERILHALAGIDDLDERLAPYGSIPPAPGALAPSHEREVGRLVGILSRPGPPLAVLLSGNDGPARRAVAGALARALDRPLFEVRSGDLPLGAGERELFLRLFAREALLTGAVLVLDVDEGESPERVRAAASAAERLSGPVVLSSREPIPLHRRPAARVELSRPSPAEQEALWAAELAGAGVEPNGQVRTLASQFSLGAGAIRGICSQLVGAESPAESARELWEACRRQARVRLDDLAERVEGAAAWEDLVMPPLQVDLLRQIAAHLRCREQVYHTWGFRKPGARGLGTSALFHGASGTGKTLAAEVLATELRLDLYRIDLSQVVSKYIGETEKNLRRVFDAAEESGALLLFDEADALFGKRSEVKDSHDRYANIEVSYLLQRMEAYRGLAILTTNLKSAIDPAFLRRIRFVVAFPFPEATHRAEIWRRSFPRELPTRGVDFARLSRLSVAGGSIRNIALNAAFLAAEAGTALDMAHLLRATRFEYGKLEKTLTEKEVEGWA
jgi:AAA+ superfamily predicted ATPase